MVNRYLLKVIKRDIASGEKAEIADKVERLIKHQDTMIWIDNCIRDKVFNKEDTIFLQALKLNHIEDDMTVEKLEALGLSRFIEKLHSSNRKVALWGCGRRGRRWLELIERNKVDIDYVIDENINIQGKMVNGFVVRSYESVKDDIDVILLMIANPAIVLEIKGLAKERIILEEGEWGENV